MTCLQQRSHVPKFGNWDGDNVPYTAYFENARKEKTGGARINPNDPEQNPEAFSIEDRAAKLLRQSYRSVSVPKFGQWDETDPRSAEGFTVIFNKVKEEKQIAAAKMPNAAQVGMNT
ncbi:hypothetical protein DH2020_041750 [Rehmannia glutinosa]|uniref:RIN4 pathogenic type III effector avirulence factor Avr cleavage site domain-containing protein n=1 Tax=Rehmannia glutinosa TaxID=99300 RepID=A0ABR0UQN4_REHGL